MRGTLVGVEAEPVLEPVELELAAGDTLVLYTDGVVDARDAAGGRFGEARLREAVDAAAGGCGRVGGGRGRRGGGGVRAPARATVGVPERARDDRAIVALRVSPR